MPDDDQDRERRAIDLAEKRARETARVEAHLAEHDRRLDRINAAIAENSGKLSGLSAEVSRLSGQFQQSVAVATARAQDAETLARKQVTSRELYITAFGVVVALVSALAAGGVFG